MTEAADAPKKSEQRPAFDENGIDRTLIRWMLALTPTQRLEQLQGWVDLIAAAHARPR
ncbi:MAG TPA: hypothetical protein VKZ49_05115 [Polyangiaceae bacterium]|jgi:hypothetical protein|nr:hypothetical protein [Polyangiaceae bacterium]